MNEKIQIGDLVKIINWGQLYSTYQMAASYMKLKKFIQGYNKRSHKDIIYTVINTYNNEKILAITDNTVDLIIGVGGVELAKKIPLIPEEAKVPQLFDINNLYPYIN
jgi:hypothetical protein